jgi:alanine racemase
VALTLTVHDAPWRAHVASTVAAMPGFVPVVKGNGYGFGIPRLAAEAAALGATELCVGTVHELAALPAPPPEGPVPLVLTPALRHELDGVPAGAVLAVGSPTHLEELLAGGPERGPWHGEVIVKVRTSMRRYGVAPIAAADLAGACESHGLTVRGFAIHPPLPSVPTDGGVLSGAEANLVEVGGLVAQLPAGLPVYVSHLDAAGWAELRAAHPARDLRIRLGTTLWHGNKSTVHLGADVVDVTPVTAGDRVGYRRTAVDAAGHLVLVTAGTSHGVARLAGGLSPYHFAQRRLHLVEDPHMHTSMCLVPLEEPCPSVGDVVDVQRPLIQTWPDRVVFD